MKLLEETDLSVNAEGKIHYIDAIMKLVQLKFKAPELHGL